MIDRMKKQIRRLVKQSKFAYVSSVNECGYPNTKAMFALKNDGMAVYYFSTNYSAKRTQQFLTNPHACVYFCNKLLFKGLMLTGTVQVCTDHEHKAMLWKKRDVMYYPQGVTDPDYCVLKFTAQRGNYYHALQTCDFDIKELA